MTAQCFYVFSVCIPSQCVPQHIVEAKGKALFCWRHRPTNTSGLISTVQSYVPIVAALCDCDFAFCQFPSSQHTSSNMVQLMMEKRSPHARRWRPQP